MPQDVMSTTDIPKDIWEYIMFYFLSTKELFFLALVNKHLLSIYQQSNALQKKIKEHAFSIHCGGNQTFLLYRSPLEINSILATGYNRFGQLALPTEPQKRFNFTAISLPQNTSVTDLKAGQRFALLAATNAQNQAQLFYTGCKNFVGVPIHKIHLNTQWVEVKLPRGIAKIKGLAATRSHAAAFGIDSISKPFAGIFGKSPIDLTQSTKPHSYQNDFKLLALPLSLNHINGMVLTDAHTFIWNEQVLLANGNLKNNMLHFTQPEDKAAFQAIPIPIKHIAGGASGEQFVAFYGTIEDNRWVVAVAGENFYGQLGTGDTLSKSTLTLVKLPQPFAVIRGIAAGMFHLVVWGEDENGGPLMVGSGFSNGQLGLTNTECHVLTHIPLPSHIHKIMDVSCGNHHTFVYALGSNEEEYTLCGGNNEYGQLGCNKKNNASLWASSPRPAYTQPLRKPPHTASSGQGLFEKSKAVLTYCQSTLNKLTHWRP